MRDPERMSVAELMRVLCTAPIHCHWLLQNETGV